MARFSQPGEISAERRFFILLTLGVDFLVLRLFLDDRFVFRPLLVFGKSPLFFYICHLYLYGAVGLFIHAPNLLLMYAIWFVGLVALYFACVRFQRFRETSSEGSIWRLI